MLDQKFMLNSFFITFLVSTSAWLMIEKTFRHWIEKKIILFWNQSFSALFTLILVGFLILLFRQNISALTFSLMGVELTAFFIPLFVEKWRRRQFEQNLLMGLDSLLLSLRSGRSFGEALSEIYCAPQSKNLGFYFLEICRLVHSKQEKPPKTPSDLIQNVFLEFGILSKSSHRVVERLKSFRYSLALQFKIQRKSKAATLQARAQSFVMIILFSAGVVHVLGQNSFDEQKGILIPATLLFAAGSYWLHKLGGPMKWKV